jgi:outer membrane protein
MDTMRMMKKYLVAGLFLLLSAGAFSQQLTRFAVIDMTKVYESFFIDSRAVRELNDQRNLIQREVDNMTAAIQVLQQNRVDALSRGDSALALQLEDEINRQTNYLQEYYRIKTQELQTQRDNLAQSNEFVQQVSSTIQRVAQSDGYSIVLSLTDMEGILWYSPSIDITDKVITALFAQ